MVNLRSCILLLMLLICNVLLVAQVHQNCVHERLTPTTKNFQKIYSEAVSSLSDAAIRNEVYQIPVVVHIVWNDSISNVSEQRIHDQIDQLNKDFNRLNENAEEVRDEFKDIVASANIEFSIAHINRVKTDTVFALEFDIQSFSYKMPDHVKSNIGGGSDPWNNREYLNLWICDIKDDLVFGYAYPPNGFDYWEADEYVSSINLDGIVLDCKAVGAPPPLIVYNESESLQLYGRTLTHEVAHYLGVRHTWGDQSIDATNCYDNDDLEDTPAVFGPSNNDCDFDKNTCNNGAADLPDMIENFMDYSLQECQNSFTKDQVGVMRYVLENYRTGLRKKDRIIAPLEKTIVYPNPSSRYVNVYFKPENENIYQATVYNSLSHEITIPTTHFVTDTQSFQFDFNNRAPGIYFIEFVSERNRFCEKIIIH